MQIKTFAMTVAVAGTLLSVGVPAARAAGTGVVDAARARDLTSVRALLKGQADVNAPQADGATALHWAAHWNDVALADLLLRAGARVNQANDFGATPLWLACVNGSEAMVTTLLQGGADPNVALPFGETPLITAARSGALGVVRALLARGAKVNTPEAARGQTALMWAAAEGHLDVMRVLVDQGATVETTSTRGFTPLMFVARQGSLDAARLLLERGAAVNAISATGATALLTAVVRGHVELAELLLDRGADPNKSGTGYTALHWAAGTWETTMTSDYNLTEGEWRAVNGLPAADAKHRLIRALVAHGADVNARAATEPPRTGFTLMSTWPYLLRKGVTPFYIAALSADAAVMRLLATLGADPRVTSDNKTTPLMVAAGRLRIDSETRIPEADALAAVKQAVALGIDVNAANDAGETALHAAAMAGLNSVVEYLVQAGASLTAQTKDGKTPLALAEDGYVFAMLRVLRPETAVLLRKLAAQ